MKTFLTTTALIALALPAMAEIKIGASISATGPAAFLGDPELKTLEMLVEDLNAKGGINGEEITLVAYDDGGDPNKARTFATRDADSAIQQAARLAAEKGAITAALYETDESRIARAEAAFAGAGVNLSINLTGNIFVNQSAAFSDFHVTGANPAGNASLTDTAFVATRFRRVMSRRLAA